MNQTSTEQNEILIRKILTALACNNINMATALIETDRMNLDQLKELDRFLREHNGEITEEQFLEIVKKAKLQEN